MIQPVYEPKPINYLAFLMVLCYIIITKWNKPNRTGVKNEVGNRRNQEAAKNRM